MKLLLINSSNIHYLSAFFAGLCQGQLSAVQKRILILLSAVSKDGVQFHAVTSSQRVSAFTSF